MHHLGHLITTEMKSELVQVNRAHCELFKSKLWFSLWNSAFDINVSFISCNWHFKWNLFYFCDREKTGRHTDTLHYKSWEHSTNHNVWIASLSVKSITFILIKNLLLPWNHEVQTIRRILYHEINKKYCWQMDLYLLTSRN